MENYFIQFSSKNFENYNNQGINSFKKSNKRNKKYIACNYKWKEFFSDDEDNSYYNLSLYNNYASQNKFKKRPKLSQDSICLNKHKSHKTQANNIFKEDNKKQSQKSDIIIRTKITNKKVSFSVDNFIKYIDVESYKKYNILNTNSEPFLEGIYYDNLKGKKNFENKADVKCTCFIF